MIFSINHQTNTFGSIVLNTKMRAFGKNFEIHASKKYIKSTHGFPNRTHLNFECNT